jgi:hypothetical protein
MKRVMYSKFVMLLHLKLTISVKLINISPVTQTLRATTTSQLKPILDCQADGCCREVKLCIVGCLTSIFHFDIHFENGQFCQ